MKSKLTYVARAVKTEYWMPGDDYLRNITEAIWGEIDNGDIIAISEKALSTAKGRIIDEGQVKPGFVAKFLARFWMRIIWGYFLGRICHLKAENLWRLQNYPIKEGSAHKQVALWYAGFLKALLWGSEGGIDASNLPYAYVSLPLDEAQKTAEEIRKYLKNKVGKNVTVMIVDTDKTYSVGGFHFTHRPSPFKEIHSFFGFVAYVLGRTLRLQQRATPLAIAGLEMNVNLALDLAEKAHRCRGSGVGPTVWDMAEKFGVQLANVTWTMLRRLKHKPIVIFKAHKYS